MSDNLQAELASARLRAQQEAFARAGIAQMEAERLQRARENTAKNDLMYKKSAQERDKQFQEQMQRQHQETMRRIRQNADTCPVQTRPRPARARPGRKASFWECVTGLIVAVLLLWGAPALVRFAHDRSGLTSSTRWWTRADGTRMREDTRYGMGGFTVTSDRSYPDPDQKRASSRNRSRQRAAHMRLSNRTNPRRSD